MAAAYDDAAYDDELADDWEAALEAEEALETAAKQAEEEKRIAKEKKQSVNKRIVGDEQEAGLDADDVGAGAGNMLAEAMDRQTGAEMLGAQAVLLCNVKPTTPEEFKQFGTDLASKMNDYKDRKWLGAAFPAMFKSLGDKLTTDELNQLLSKLHVLSNQAQKKAGDPKKSGPTTSAPALRGSRNADMDAFQSVEDRGGAFVTEDQDFM